MAAAILTGTVLLPVRGRTQYVRAVRDGNVGQRATHQIGKTDFLCTRTNTLLLLVGIVIPLIFPSFSSVTFCRIVLLLLFLFPFADENTTARKFPFLLLFSFGAHNKPTTTYSSSSSSSLVSNTFSYFLYTDRRKGKVSTQRKEQHTDTNTRTLRDSSTKGRTSAQRTIQSQQALLDRQTQQNAVVFVFPFGFCLPSLAVSRPKHRKLCYWLQTHARTHKTHNNDRNKRRSSRKLKLRAVTCANCTSENCTNTTTPQVKGPPSLPNLLTLESQKIKTFTHHIKQNQYTLRITERDARASETERRLSKKRSSDRALPRWSQIRT